MLTSHLLQTTINIQFLQTKSDTALALPPMAASKISGELLQLPPSANWYSASVIASSKPSLVAFASKNTIRLLNPETRRITGVLVGHADRVTSVEFCGITGQLCHQCFKLFPFDWTASAHFSCWFASLCSSVSIKFLLGRWFQLPDRGQCG